MRRRDPRATRLAARRGFTRIELLVVIAVILVLIGLSFPAYSAVRRSSQRKTTKALLQRVALACDSYENDWGDYPPSVPAKVGLRSNGRNDGIEVLVRCLTTAQKGGPYLDEVEDSLLGNGDDDAIGGTDPTGSNLGTKALLELKDPWGNPILYLHHSEYDKGGPVELLSGELVKVPAAKSEVTQQYADLTRFQLRSAGPDGVFQTDDDVTSWGD